MVKLLVYEDHDRPHIKKLSELFENCTIVDSDHKNVISDVVISLHFIIEDQLSIINNNPNVVIYNLGHSMNGPNDFNLYGFKWTHEKNHPSIKHIFPSYYRGKVGEHESVYYTDYHYRLLDILSLEYKEPSDRSIYLPHWTIPIDNVYKYMIDYSIDSIKLHPDLYNDIKMVSKYTKLSEETILYYRDLIENEFVNHNGLSSQELYSKYVNLITDGGSGTAVEFASYNYINNRNFSITKVDHDNDNTYGSNYNGYLDQIDNLDKLYPIRDPEVIVNVLKLQLKNIILKEGL